MSKSIFIVFLGISVFTGIVPPLTQGASAQTSVSFQVFYDQLSPYGSWVDYPSYGYVWVPAGREGFRPYGTRGHWVYTEDGWTWVSDYSWGWAAFHYGNWFYDDSYGWMWAPGYEWAPAWVTWGEYGGNYCWAPVGPHVNFGVSFTSYRPPYNYWNFCPRDRITNVNVSHYYVNNIRNTTVINRITVINNVRTGGGGGAYHRGPVAANVERFTHTPVRPVAIRASSRPGTASVQNGQLAIYRPTVRNYNAGVRPPNVRDLHALRPINNPRAANQPAARTDRPANPGARPDAHTAPANDNPSGNRPAASPPRALMPHQQHTGDPRHAADPTPHQQQQERPIPAQTLPQRPAQIPQHTTPHPLPHPGQPGPQRNLQPHYTEPHPEQPRQNPQPHNMQPHTAQPRPMPQQPMHQATQPVNRPVQQQPMNRPAPQPHPAGPPPGGQPHEHHR